MKKIYVSKTDGNDSWSGLYPDSNTGHTNGPVQTLEKARDIASNTINAQEVIEIIIREGTYNFSTPFILNSSNSGNSATVPIVFKAYNDEIVKLSAANSLDPLSFSLVTSTSNPTIYNRLHPDAKGNVYVYSLPLTDLGNFTSYWNGKYLDQQDQLSNTCNEYLLPYSASQGYCHKGSDLPPIPELSVDGELYTLCRWPAEGYAEVKEVVEAGSTSGNLCNCITSNCPAGSTPCYSTTSDCNYTKYTGTNSFLNGKIPQVPWGIDGIFKYDSSYDSVISRWPNPSTNEMFLVGSFAYDFQNEGLKVLELDKTNRTIKINSHRTTYGLIQFDQACYGRSANSSEQVNCSCKNSSGTETIPLLSQKIKNCTTGLDTSSYMESNDNLVTRRWSTTNQRWRQGYWADQHPRRWFALNILEELNSPGQYYIDRTNNKLYIWPKSPLPGATDIQLSKVTPFASDNMQVPYETDRKQSIIKIIGANNIKFENIHICDTSGNGIDIIRSNNITLKNCNIYNIRKTGIRIMGGTNNNIDGCNIYDTGGIGILIGGGDKIKLTKSYNTIQNCDITRTGINQRINAAIASIVCNGVGNIIRKNKIYNVSTQAIQLSGNNHLIEYNNIHDILLEVDDSGAIYQWSNISDRGTIIQYNLFRNIQNKLRATPIYPSANANGCHGTIGNDPNGDSNLRTDGWFGHCAIYFDNFSGGSLIQSNIFYKCGNKDGKHSLGAIFTNMGIDVRAINNIFIDCPLAFASHPNVAYYTSETANDVNTKQITAWETILNDKGTAYYDGTPNPGNFNGWSVLLNWNGTILGDENSQSFKQLPKLFEYNWKEFGVISQCDIRSAAYKANYPNLMGIKDDSATPSSFLYFDSDLQKIKVNRNYLRGNIADKNIFVQTPYKTSTYNSWNQILKTWTTTNDQVIQYVEDAGFVDIINGDFELKPSSPILSNTLHEKIPVEKIAGFYEETEENTRVTIDLKDFPIYFERMDGINATWGEGIGDASVISNESIYLKNNPETKKYIMVYQRYYDAAGNSLNNSGDEATMIATFKNANLTKTIENALIRAAKEYNNYIKLVNEDTVGGTKNPMEHMGDTPLIIFDYETPIYSSILGAWTNKTTVDNTWGVGTWDYAITFAAAMIPKAKELVNNSTFRAQNNIPDIFVNAKFAHYQLPFASANVTLNGGPYQLQNEDDRFSYRKKTIADSCWSKIIETQDFLAPTIYSYYPMQDDFGVIDPANCSGFFTYKNTNEFDFNKQQIYDNILVCLEWMSRTGIEKDIYPILGYSYIGDEQEFFNNNCNNLKFNYIDTSKEFWGSRQLTLADTKTSMELALQAGKQRIKGFLYWNMGYFSFLSNNITSCNLPDLYKARAIYSRDIKTEGLGYIENDSFWPSRTCTDQFSITYVTQSQSNYIEVHIITPPSLNGKTIEIYRKTTDTGSNYSKIGTIVVDSLLSLYTDTTVLLTSKTYQYKAVVAGTTTSTNEILGKFVNLSTDAYWKRGDDGDDVTWVDGILTTIINTSDTNLATKYTNESAEKRLYVRDYDRTIFAFIQRWFRSDRSDDRYYTQAIRMLEISLSNFINTSPTNLANSVTLNGSIDSINLDLRDACLHFAQLGFLTENTSYINKANTLLNTFADKIPSWKIWNPYYESNYANRTAKSASDPITFQDESASGIWGNWIYFDLVMGTPLLEAWALIRNNPNITVTETKMKTLFDYFLNIYTLRASQTTPYVMNGQPDYTNMDSFQIRGEIDFGLLIPDPEILHKGITHLNNLYKIRFAPDGCWNEVSPAYHSDLQRGLNNLMKDFPSVYTDPIGFTSTDGTRYDSLDPLSRFRTQRERADYFIQYMKYPNDLPIAIGDTNYNSYLTTDFRYSKQPPRVIPASSNLFGASGIATLTSGTAGNETMVTLNYGAFNTHKHRDKLNLNVFCKGQEVISETEYQPVSGDTLSSRGWHSSTPGHVTVTVNEQNQDPGTNRRYKTTNPLLDPVTGIPDWGYRWNSSSSTDYGKLRLFNTDFSKVKVMEVDAEKSYNSAIPSTTKYRRTVALVDIDNGDNYIVDIFRIVGGVTHDYMLHSCLHSDHTVTLTGISPTTTSGTLYTGGWSSGGTDYTKWGLDKLQKVTTATTNSNWSAEFTPVTETNWKLNTYMLGSSGTNIINCSGPAMRIPNKTLPFICVRRTGSQPTTSTYVAVHHVTTKTGTSRISSIQSLSSTNSDVIAFKVTFTNGRSDIIISGESPTSSATIDSRIAFTGAFAHIAENTSQNGSNQWAYLVDGSQLNISTPYSLSILGNVSYSGQITSIQRKEQGNTYNKFITNVSIPASSNLSNYTLLVDPASLQRWSYNINSTSNTEIITLNEPGLTISGSNVKQEYFPNWGDTGTVQFRIPGSALMLKNDIDGTWGFTQTGSAVGTAPSTIPTFVAKTDSSSRSYYEIDGILNPLSISSSSNNFGCFVSQNGKVYCFGTNTDGQCTIPSDVGTIQQISCGYAHTLALRQDGTIIAWGSNGSKQGRSGTQAIQAQITAAGRYVTKISAGAEHNLALLDNGDVVAWGKNESAQLSDPDTYWTEIGQFGTTWPGGYNTQSLETFKYYQDKSTRWGTNQIRQYRCGYYADANRYTGCESPNASALAQHKLYSNVNGSGGNPIPPSTYLSASYSTGWTPHTGAPYDYQFSRSTTGDNTSVNYSGGGWTRNTISTSAFGVSNKKYKDIAAGRSHNLLLTTDNKIETWGDNYYYQITGTGPFAADNRTGFGIRTDDPTKYTYTNNSYSVVKSMKTTSNSVSKIAASYYTNMVIKSDNTIYYWARNDMDQSQVSNLTLPGAEIPTFINGTYEHTMVIGNAGTLKTTGRWIDTPYTAVSLFVISIPATTFKWAGGARNWTIAVTSSNKIVLWGTTQGLTEIGTYTITTI